MLLGTVGLDGMGRSARPPSKCEDDQTGLDVSTVWCQMMRLPPTPCVIWGNGGPGRTLPVRTGLGPLQ